MIESHHRLQDDLIEREERLHSYNHDAEMTDPSKMHKKRTFDPRVTENPEHQRDVMGAGDDNMLMLAAKSGTDKGRDTIVVDGHEYLVDGTAPEDSRPGTNESKRTRPQRPRSESKESRPDSVDGAHEPPLPPPRVPRMDTAGLGLPLLSSLPNLPVIDDTDIGAPPLERAFSRLSAEVVGPIIAEMRRPVVASDCMRDPLTESFYQDTWNQVAENNTYIFREVFRCQPDNEVKTWKEYREYAAYGERFNQSQGGGKSKMASSQDTPGISGPPGHGVGALEKVGELFTKVLPGVGTKENQQHGKVEEWGAEQEKQEREIVEAMMTPEKDEVLHEKSTPPQNGESSTSLNGGRTSPAIPSKASLKKGPANPVQDSIADGAVQANRISSNGSSTLNEKASSGGEPERTDMAPNGVSRNRTVTISEPSNGSGRASTSKRGRRRGNTRSSMRAFAASDETLLEKHDAEELLKMVQGTLVLWPYDW